MAFRWLMLFITILLVVVVVVGLVLLMLTFVTVVRLPLAVVTAIMVGHDDGIRQKNNRDEMDERRGEKKEENTN